EGRKGRQSQKGAEQPARWRNNRAPFWRAAGRHRFQGRNATEQPGPRAYRGPPPKRRAWEADGPDGVSERFREGYSEWRRPTRSWKIRCRTRLLVQVVS